MPAISGTIWMEEAPVPITATRLPVRSESWFHRAEWKTSPWKVSMPSMSGIFGSESAPAAETTTSAVREPALVVTRHRLRSASQVASSTEVPNRNRSITCERSATRRR